MKEKVGRYYKLFALKINGIRYYFIADMTFGNNGGFQWVFRNSEQAVEMFEKLEQSAVKYPPTV